MREDNNFVYLRDSQSQFDAHGYEIDVPDRVTAGGMMRPWHDVFPAQQTVIR